jgi:hypothetical protein
MAISINDTLVLAAQMSIEGKMFKVVSNKHVPYSNSADVLATITATRRHIGQLFRVANGAAIEDWEFVGGIADENLVKKVTASAGGLGFEIAATYSAITGSVAPRLIEVTDDETNNGNNSLYLYNGISIKFLQTIA